ncbi:pilus assembly protein CpaE [Tistlia consotensis]|uniref:Pilus assembly protein CpaE n=1 Tax=Tistlia consotensis USBA 355 TaxID=560819 RepID=A0A1Y6BQ39_9PROT|nr:hypothetical protein [Tistlia consotensis]SMF12552.1 pilus assembly protein CpaE [Tistlia consotensis USBA 355]SNR51003.1 pilus assembly protein CpaE [Tistlia consotensis]
MALALIRNEGDEQAAAAAGPVELLAFLADDESRRVVGDWAAVRGWAPEHLRPGGPAEAVEALSGGLAPRLLVVDLDGEATPEEACRSLSLQAPATTLIAVGSSNDAQLYRSLLRHGVSDYLVKPLTPALLEEASRPRSLGGVVPAEPGPAKRGRISLFVGLRGGVGASTLAVNSAWMLAEERKARTALVDLDLHFGIGALALDLEPGRGLREALENPARMDVFLLLSAGVNASETLCVLGAEEPLEAPSWFDDDALVALLDELAGSFEQIVVELPRHLMISHRQTLLRADDLVLVSDLSLAGVRDSGRALQLLQAVGRETPPLLVAGRVGKGRPAQVDKASFERSVGVKLTAVVPEDAKTLTACANGGKPLLKVAPKAGVTAAVRGLADVLSPPPVVAKGGLFRRLRGRGKGTSA